MRQPGGPPRVRAIDCARQEAAAARALQETARQEAAATRDPPGHASQDADNNYNKNDNVDNDDIDNDDDEYDGDKDEYKDVVGRFFARVDATMAKIQAMDDGFENRAAVREKALANEANKQEWAAAWEKVWADELRQMAAWENALADKTDELRQAATLEKALADEANKRRQADTLKKALADEAYERRWTAMRKKVLGRSRPCLRVGCRHGPRAPNPHEHLIRGRRHWPQAPNQSTGNGWA